MFDGSFTGLEINGAGFYARGILADVFNQHLAGIAMRAGDGYYRFHSYSPQFYFLPFFSSILKDFAMFGNSPESGIKDIYG